MNSHEKFESLTREQKTAIRTLVQGRMDHWRHLNGKISREKLGVFYRDQFITFAELDLACFGIHHEGHAADIIIWFVLNSIEKTQGVQG